MSVDVRALLSVSMDDIKRPEPLPSGIYHAIIAGHKFGQANNEKKTPKVTFEYTNLELAEGQEHLFEEGLTAEKVAKGKMQSDFFLTPDSMWRLKEFLESLGIEVQGRSLEDAIQDTSRRDVTITAELQPNQKKPTEPGFLRAQAVVGRVSE